jgi:hypothetical protein
MSSQEVDATVDFRISTLQSSIFGTLRNDAGEPIPGVTVIARGPSVSRTSVTRDDGGFEFKGLAAGEYIIETIADSYPGGYALESVPVVHVATTPGASGHADLTLRAARSIAGVVAYDTHALRTLAVPGARVRLVELALESTTDANGDYSLPRSARRQLDARCERCNHAQRDAFREAGRSARHRSQPGAAMISSKSSSLSDTYFNQRGNPRPPSRLSFPNPIASCACSHWSQPLTTGSTSASLSRPISATAPTGSSFSSPPASPPLACSSTAQP